MFYSQGYFYLADLLVAEEGELNRKRRETQVNTWHLLESVACFGFREAGRAGDISG